MQSYKLVKFIGILSLLHFCAALSIKIGKTSKNNFLTCHDYFPRVLARKIATFTGLLVPLTEDRQSLKQLLRKSIDKLDVKQLARGNEILELRLEPVFADISHNDVFLTTKSGKKKHFNPIVSFEYLFRTSVFNMSAIYSFTLFFSLSVD